MNLHERGKRLSRIVTAAVGVAAVIGASALGLHDWADIVTTKAQATSTASGGSDARKRGGQSGARGARAGVAKTGSDLQKRPIPPVFDDTWTIRPVFATAASVAPPG